MVDKKQDGQEAMSNAMLGTGALALLYPAAKGIYDYNLMQRTGRATLGAKKAQSLFDLLGGNLLEVDEFDNVVTPRWHTTDMAGIIDTNYADPQNFLSDLMAAHGAKAGQGAYPSIFKTTYNPPKLQKTIGILKKISESLDYEPEGVKNNLKPKVDRAIKELSVKNKRPPLPFTKMRTPYDALMRGLNIPIVEQILNAYPTDPHERMYGSAPAATGQSQDDLFGAYEAAQAREGNKLPVPSAVLQNRTAQDMSVREQNRLAAEDAWRGLMADTDNRPSWLRRFLGPLSGTPEYATVGKYGMAPTKGQMVRGGLGILGGLGATLGYNLYARRDAEQRAEAEAAKMGKSAERIAPSVAGNLPSLQAVFAANPRFQRNNNEVENFQRVIDKIKEGTDKGLTVEDAIRAIASRQGQEAWRPYLRAVINAMPANK